MGRVVRPSPITHLRRPPKCTIHNFFIIFFMEGFQRGRVQSWHEPRFYLRRFIGGFFTWDVPISWHVPRFYLLKFADVVRFPSAFGPWWACNFSFFLFLFVFLERERYQSTKFPGAPPIPSTMQLPIQTGVGAPTASIGDGSGSLCGPLLVCVAPGDTCV